GRDELVGEDREQHRVLPLTVPEIRLPLDALAHEPGALGMCDRPHVEPVAGELDPVVPELVDEVPLREPRRAVCKAASPERRVDRERLEVHDAMAFAHLRVPVRAGALAAVQDQHPAEALRLADGAIDLGGDPLAVARTAAAEERLDVVAGVELEQPVHVRRLGSAQRDHDGSTTGDDAGCGEERETAVPRATPPRINASPPIAVAPTPSPRKIAPYASATGGTR